MKQGAIIEIAYDSQEWYPGLLTLMCDELETFGFVRMWGTSIFRFSNSSNVKERPSTSLRCGSRTTLAKAKQRQPGQ